MKSLWNDQNAAQSKTDLEQRVYSSRLLGSDPSLVLHGGGNTSVKVTEPDLFGEPLDLLYVKGSGWDLASIQAAGFAPVRMDHLLRLSGRMRLRPALKPSCTPFFPTNLSITLIRTLWLQSSISRLHRNDWQRFMAIGSW
jgi:rhamnose utilization protein RhaD (predicted bifunctional aldolase and dehydrogenase)